MLRLIGMVFVVLLACGTAPRAEDTDVQRLTELVVRGFENSKVPVFKKYRDRVESGIFRGQRDRYEIEFVHDRAHYHIFRNLPHRGLNGGKDNPSLAGLVIIVISRNGAGTLETDWIGDRDADGFANTGMHTSQASLLDITTGKDLFIEEKACLAGTMFCGPVGGLYKDTWQERYHQAMRDINDYLGSE